MYHLKTFKDIHGGVLLLLLKVTLLYGFFFTFFKLYKWYQIAQRILSILSLPENCLHDWLPLFCLLTDSTEPSNWFCSFVDYLNWGTWSNYVKKHQKSFSSITCAFTMDPQWNCYSFWIVSHLQNNSLIIFLCNCLAGSSKHSFTFLFPTLLMRLVLISIDRWI